MDPWHIGPRLRYWRTQRGLSTRVLADLIARSPSWVQMVEQGRRSPYNILDLANIAVALQLDLGVFITSPVPGIPDGDQQAMLSLLKRAFAGRDPRDGLADLARIADSADAEDDLMLIVEPGGRLSFVNRREALKTGGVMGISLAGSLGWLYQEEAREASARSSPRTAHWTMRSAPRRCGQASRRIFKSWRACVARGRPRRSSATSVGSPASWSSSPAGWHRTPGIGARLGPTIARRSPPPDESATGRSPRTRSAG